MAIAAARFFLEGKNSRTVADDPHPDTASHPVLSWLYRRYAPAVGALAIALLLMLPLGMIRESQLLSGIYAVARLAPALAIVGSVIFGLIATVKLWRWNQGSSPLVCECGGLLGRERLGRFGAYRKCLACSRNVNEKYYA